MIFSPYVDILKIKENIVVYIFRTGKRIDVINGQTSSIDVEDVYSIEYEKRANCTQKDTCWHDCKQTKKVYQNSTILG